VEATGRQVRWAGAAFFRIAAARIVSLWVLGDVEGLKQQLSAGRDQRPFKLF
jgi:predicted ester cyclase